jgi:hypothetical protein
MESGLGSIHGSIAILYFYPHYQKEKRKKRKKQIRLQATRK